MLNLNFVVFQVFVEFEFFIFEFELFLEYLIKNRNNFQPIITHIERPWIIINYIVIIWSVSVKLQYN